MRPNVGRPICSGADVRLATEPHAHPLAGRWVPDIAIETPTGVTRVAKLARDGRPLLLDFTHAGAAHNTQRYQRHRRCRR